MTRLDNNMEQYLAQHTTPLAEVLQDLTRHTNLITYNPRMLSGPSQGKLLEFICRMVKPARVLEIGAFTGFSTICMAGAIPDTSVVDTIEVNDELEDTILDYVGRAGLSHKVNLYLGDACGVIPTLNQTYDLVFIDGDKREYPQYYNLVFPLVRSGGYILADNVLWSGKVLDKNATDLHTQSIIAFNSVVQQDTRVENVLLPIRDGLMLIRKL